MIDIKQVPTAHDHIFIPYPLGLDVGFEKCLPPTLLEEGGYSNDAHDPGGMTMYGIIQREYDLKRRQWGLPTQWVKNISKAETQTIYYTDYWLPYAPELPIGLAQEFWDLDVNGGGHRAVVTLQRALGISDDGAFGPATKAAVDAVVAKGQPAITNLIDKFCADREAFYRSLGTFRYFGTDWIRRSENMKKLGEKEESELDKALDDFTNNPPKPIMKE